MISRGWFLLIVSALLYNKVASEKGCPPEEEIVPCTCQELYYSQIQCKNIMTPDVLVNVFKKAERYEFDQFSLIDSSLQYIPHQIFENVNVKDLTLDKVTFINTFDELPKNPGLKRIYISRTKVTQGWDWAKLALFKDLEDLSIEDVTLKKLSTEFRPNISKKLKVLRLSWCKLKKFSNEEFKEFTELEKFTATHDDLTTVSRSLFSNPSKLKEISFEYNRISTVPEDMFSNMPDLMLISFGNNQLTLLPENTFKPIIAQIKYLRLQDNPFRCDCRMKWIIHSSKEVKYFYGVCDYPANLKKKQLKDLTWEDFSRC